jgi:hypothetical protein
VQGVMAVVVTLDTPARPRRIATTDLLVVAQWP